MAVRTWEEIVKENKSLKSDLNKMTKERDKYKKWSCAHEKSEYEKEQHLTELERWLDLSVHLRDQDAKDYGLLKSKLAKLREGVGGEVRHINIMIGRLGADIYSSAYLLVKPLKQIATHLDKLAKGE